MPPGPDARVKITEAYARLVARDAYFWAWPMVNIYNRRLAFAQCPEPGLMNGVLPFAPLNRSSVLHDYVKPEQRRVACPNQDVAYGAAICGLDISPVVIQVPDFGERFWVYQAVDLRTDGFAQFGKMYGTQPGFYLLVAPDWDREVPKGIKQVFRCKTNTAFIVPRVFMDDTAEDRKAILSVISGIDTYPLSEYTGKFTKRDYTKLRVFEPPWRRRNRRKTMTTKATPSRTQQKRSPAPPLIEQINNGNWLDKDEAEALRNELYYQRAIHSYMTMLPAMNTIGMRDGSEAVFGKGYNILPIWKDRMDARCWVPTPNADVIYSMSYLDLKKDGPLVVAAPHDVIGMFTDFFQRTITDVGLIGPDRARGGLYLLIPPDYDGEIPQGYFAFKSSTYNVLLFFRTIMGKGAHAPDPSKAVALAEQIRVYPLWEMEKDVKPMEFPNGSGKRVNMMYPTDFSFWTKLKEFIDYEPVSAFDPETRGILASIGILKSKPFKPTPKQKELLEKAVTVAPKMILATRQLGRADKRDLYYEDRQYQNTWAGGTAEWLQESYRDVTQRSCYFQIAFSTASAMVMRTLGAGSKYPFAVADADGKFLDGSNNYKLHLPTNPPAGLFWAVTSYNITDGTMTEAAQLLPSINSLGKVATNDDGSVDIWFGPEKPAKAPDTNWIQTIESRNFIAALRLYGTGVDFFDQTWKPDDLVKVN